MPWSLTPSGWVVLVIGGVVVLAGGLVAAMRALWLYRAPPWLRRTLLSLLAGGSVLAGAGLLFGSDLIAIGGLAIAIVPLGGWLVNKSILHTGPPLGLMGGPRHLDKADDVVDAVGRLIGFDRRDDSE